MTVATDLKRLREGIGELVARHERAEGVETFARYRDDPCGFLTDVLHVKNLWSRQQEIAELVREHRQVVVRSCNSLGKDFLGARLAVWWAVARGGLVILTGPTDRQVGSVLMKEVGRAFRSNPDLPGELYARALRIGDEDKILAFTATDPDKFTGFHDPETLVVITEGQGVEPDIYEAAQACATSAGSRLLVLGNPLRPSGTFYSICRSENWVSVRVPASEHPNVVEGREVIPGAVTQQWVESIAREYGKDSPQYRARVEAEFPEDDVSALFKRLWIDQAFDRWRKCGGQGPRESERKLIADIAGGGADRTCVGTARADVIERLEFWPESDLMKIAKKLAETSREYGRWDAAVRRQQLQDGEIPQASITVDVGGLGLGVADRLSELRASVTRFNGASTASSKTKFANKRAESYWLLRKRLERDGVALPPDEGLAAELLATEWSVDSSGRILIAPKDDIRSRIGRSPDAADVCAMAQGAGLGTATSSVFRWV